MVDRGAWVVDRGAWMVDGVARAVSGSPGWLLRMSRQQAVVGGAG